MTDGAPFYPHYPSFAITPDGVVVRALSPNPPPKAHTAVQPAIIHAPFHTQFDGSIYAESNCGPTTLSMALGALGVSADQLKLRALANRHMGTDSPDNGTSWESLAYAAHQYGVSTTGLKKAPGKGYRKWTLDDVKNEVTKGHPVLLLVHYRDLPKHHQSSFTGNHYIVALGFDRDGNLVYNDPAAQGGAYLKAPPAEIAKAWSNVTSGLTFTAMALQR